MNYSDSEVRQAVLDSVHYAGNGDVVTKGLYRSTKSFAYDVIRRMQKRDPVTPQEVIAKFNASVRYIGSVPVLDEGILDGGEMVMILSNGQRFRVLVTELARRE